MTANTPFLGSGTAISIGCSLNFTENLLDNPALLYELSFNLGGIITAGGYNWWGVTDPTLIMQRIYDFYDYPYYGIFNFPPFLSAPSFSATPINNFSLPIIWSNTNWTTNINVTLSVWITPLATLTISPGVVAAMANQTVIMCYGNLVAIGNSANPIIITNMSNSRWGFININSPARTWNFIQFGMTFTMYNN